MTLKAKNSDTNESLDDENSKMKSYITRESYDYKNIAPHSYPPNTTWKIYGQVTPIL